MGFLLHRYIVEYQVQTYVKDPQIPIALLNMNIRERG